MSEQLLVPRSVQRAGLGAFLGLFYLYFLKYTVDGLRSWFSLDDLMNLSYYWARPWTALLKANLLFYTAEARPLGALYYTGIHRMWGFNPLPFRIGALVLLSLNLALLFLVVRELSGSIEAACLALIVTGLNESFVWAYYDTGMIYDVLVFSCYFGTLYYYLRMRRMSRQPTAGKTVMILILYICALNAKEIAVSLPIALLLYELFWHPPAGFRISQLMQWTIGSARVALMSGAIALIYIAGLLKSPAAQMPAYQAKPSIALYLANNAHYLRQLSLGLFRPRPSGMLGIFLGTFVIACVLRKKHLIFASLMAMISVLPIAFIPVRQGSVFYLPSLFWSLWVAGILVALRELFVRKLGTRTRLVSQVALLLGLFLYVGQINAKAFAAAAPVMRSIYDRNRRYDGEIHRALPRIPRGGKVVILNDPWPAFPYEATFWLQLSYNDPTMTADTLRAMQAINYKYNPKEYDFQLDFADDHFRLPLP